MATPRRQNPLDSQGARTPMNGELRTDLIRLITRTRTESLLGDDDLAPARPTDASTLRDKMRVIVSANATSSTRDASSLAA